jgi:dTDP-4-amino-4,6-dideoxygalactose transaminase
MARAIRENGHVAAGGPFGDQREALLAQRLGQPALLTSSCRQALEMAALVLGIERGDSLSDDDQAQVITRAREILNGF